MQVNLKTWKRHLGLEYDNPGYLCVSRDMPQKTYEAKFRSENLLENGNKNR